ncbi:serine/threonine-protein kinase pkn1 [mine drainage metagenome]|uniref:Serine/threonine-protein kinase pkn1 n=1 Tax=mine drainage metagenome TaxID=410659 RepID=A0A1J5RR39_9ZZZZ
MANIQKGLLAVLFLISTPALAEVATDPFQEVAARYLAANPKPVLSEEAHKYKVQAEFAVQEKRNDKAIELYGKALEIAPWWPEGHYQLALVLGETKKYRDAMREMKRYLLLAPAAPEARAAQDKIYQWESVAEPEAGRTFKDCPECPEMVELPAGSFDMGSNNGEADEKPVHPVAIAQPFAIGKTEVTQAQWHAIMGNDPSYFSTCGDTCPVEQVSWDDAQAFIQKLNARTGKQYRLPTEAEWEYACRAGKQQEYCGSDSADSVSWNSFNSGSFFFNTPHPVATKQANAFGLFDMSGNVWEWVADNYHDDYNGAPADGSAWMGGSMHVLRGGSWGYDQKFGRAASRSKFGATYRYYSYGFRLARTLP